MIRRKLKDLIRGFFVVFREYRGETTGMIGLSLIISMIILALLAPSLAPETNQKWDNVDRWRDLPGGAPPFWMNYFSSTSKARHQVKNEPDSLSSESVITTLVYNYQFDSDLPPKDIIFYVKGKYTSDRPTLIASLIRPGGEKVQLATRDIQGTEGEDGYTFETRLTMFGGSQQRTKVHRFAKEYEEGSTPDPSEIDVTRTAFAKAQDGMLSRTEPLNGEYKIELLLVGPGTELTNSRAIFTGRVYGLMGTDG
ncbi:MAG: hypothetical protein V5A87_04790, partial [Candidatus Bipolaricaulota bacterium]